MPKELTHKIQYNQKRLELHKLYRKVREVREEKASKDTLTTVWQELQSHSDDWLCAVEILEISTDEALSDEIKSFLQNTSADATTKALIQDSLTLLQ